MTRDAGRRAITCLWLSEARVTQWPGRHPNTAASSIAGATSRRGMGSPMSCPALSPKRIDDELMRDAAYTRHAISFAAP